MKRTVNTVLPSLCLREKAGLHEQWKKKGEKEVVAGKKRMRKFRSECTKEDGG